MTFTDTNGPTSPPPRAAWRRLVPVTLLKPVLCAAVGIDGGQIFQILAVENLGVGATALGIAFGFGVLSLPFQLAAARISLRRARPNLQWFLIVTAVQAWILAVLVAAGATGGVAMIALVVAVTAELAVSILFATAWQPLLSFTADPANRQRLNSTWQAIARGVLAGSLIAIGAFGDGFRVVFLILIGIAAVAAAAGLRRVPGPRVDGDARREEDGSIPGDRPRPDSHRLLFVVLGLVNFGAMPLWLVYLDAVLWRDGSLGVVAAVQIAAVMVAMLAWRPTERDVTGRALAAAVITLAGTGLVAAVPGPDPDLTGQALLLIATALTAIGATTANLALLEIAHRSVDNRTAVRTFTLLDVVESTSLQAGLAVAGFLIAASTSTGSWPIDPYQLLVIGAALTTLVASLQLRRRQLRPTAML
jgi:hypothetical protein